MSVSARRRRGSEREMKREREGEREVKGRSDERVMRENEKMNE